MAKLVTLKLYVCWETTKSSYKVIQNNNSPKTNSAHLKKISLKILLAVHNNNTYVVSNF